MERGKGVEGKEEGGGLVQKMLEEVTSRREFEDTEEMVQWRSINQEEVDNLWNEMSEKMEEEVEEKHRVEKAKKGAYKGRGEPLEWRIVTRITDISLANGVKIVGREYTNGLEKTACNEIKACRRQVTQKKKD